MKLRVAFDEPNHGWIGISVRTADDTAGAQSFSDSMSYTPYASLWELITALNLLAEGPNTATANWFAEPTRYEFRFARTKDDCSLAVLQFTEFVRLPTTRLSAYGTFNEICRPFWKALRDLQSAYSADELNRRLHSPFPTAELARLTTRIRASSPH